MTWENDKMTAIRLQATFLALAIMALAAGSKAAADAYRMNIKTNVENGQLDGDLTLRYTNLGKQSLESLRMRLDVNLSSTGSMDVTHVRDSSGQDLQWRYVPFNFATLQSEKGQMEINLAEPLDANAEIELQIVFQFKDRRFLNEEMVTLQDDPYHSFDAWYPKAMTRSDDSWSIDDDRIGQYDVSVELPQNLANLASTGQVVDSRPAGPNETVVRLTANGVRGFTIYASPHWETHQRKVDGVELRVHLPADSATWAERMLDTATDVIGFYRGEYGEYPADHLEIVCVGSEDGRAHGSSATCNGILIWLHANLEEQYQFLVAHEIAHQYFGSSVGIHRAEIAWAQIGSGLMMDHHYMVHRGLNEESIRKTMKWFYLEAIRRGFDTTLSQPVEKPMQQGLPWSRGWNMSLMHGKAYEVCKMLDSLLGEEKFKNVIRKILNQRKGALLTGADFIAFCEEEYGESLDWFVVDWIDGNRTLDYAVTSVKPVDGNWEVEISKIGDAAFPVVIEAKTESGETHRQRIDHTKAVNRLSFASSDRLRSVIVDPESTCPDVDLSNNTWPK